MACTPASRPVFPDAVYLLGVRPLFVMMRPVVSAAQTETGRVLFEARCYD